MPKNQSKFATESVHSNKGDFLPREDFMYSFFKMSSNSIAHLVAQSPHLMSEMRRGAVALSSVAEICYLLSLRELTEYT